MRSSAYGIQPMPLSPKEIRRFGYRSRTAAPITAARMLTRFIWNPATLVKNAARRVSPGCRSRTPGGSDGKVWKGSGRVTALAVVVEPGRRHHVHPTVLPGHVLRARRPDAADEPERRPLLGRPLQSVGPFHDVGHAVLHERRGVRGEEIRREPGHVDVTVGRDPRVAHIALPSEMSRC